MIGVGELFSCAGGCVDPGLIQIEETIVVQVAGEGNRVGSLKRRVKIVTGGEHSPVIIGYYDVRERHVAGIGYGVSPHDRLARDECRVGSSVVTFVM